MSFDVLGPLRVSAAGLPVAVRGSRQRTILSVLLLHANRIVSVDKLVEAVWQGSPPATARTQIAICIAALRKAFKAEGEADEVIRTAHPGYRLSTDGHRLDLLDFEALTTRAAEEARTGNTADAADGYRRALGLWQGPVLPGVHGREVEDAAARLEERRRLVYDEFALLQLELGKHQELIPQLTALVREHPLREHSRRALMLAQYRAGLRAEALETFREGRRHSIDELGLEPGPALHELHQAILNDDVPGALPTAPAQASAGPRAPAVPGPGVPASRSPAKDSLQYAAPRHTGSAAPSVPAPREPVPHQLPAGPLPGAAQQRGLVPPPSDLPPNVPSFIGRDGELARLDLELTPRADDEPPAMALITGIAGIGKTGLAVHWAHRAARLFPDGRLYVDLCGHDPDHSPTAPSDVLSRFLRRLGVPGEQIPADMEDRVSLYRSLLSGRRLLLLLDNVLSYAQIQPLLPATGGCTVVVTGREPLEQLTLRHGALRLQLDVLNQEEATDLLSRMVGDERLTIEPAQSLRLAELCDGLPLALRISAARLASRPHWSVRQLVSRLTDESRRLDELSSGEARVRASFALSYRHLPGDAATLYRRLGLLEVPHFAAWVAAALMDCDAYEAERLLEVLVDAQLLTVVGQDVTGRMRFRFHDLLRLFARELAQREPDQAAQTTALDRALAGWLTIAEVAHRREYGGDFSLIHGRTPRPPMDPDLLDELITEPLEWFEAERLSILAVIEHASRLAGERRAAQPASSVPETSAAPAREPGLEELAWDLALSIGVLCETHHYPDDWRAGCDHALAATRACGNRRGEAAMLSEIGSLLVQQVRMEEAESYLRPALELFEETGERHGWALANARMATIDRHWNRPQQAERRLRSSCVVLHECGDVSAEAHALNNLAQLALDRDELAAGLELSERAVAIARGVGENRGTAQAVHRLARVYLAAGRWRQAEAALQEVLRIVRAKHDLLGIAYALLGLGEAHLGADEPVRAARELEDGLAPLEALGSPLVEGRIRLALSEAYGRTGRPDEAHAMGLQARSAFERADSPSWIRRADSVLASLPTRPDPAPDLPGHGPAAVAAPPVRGLPQR
ncbi:AfsR/SARP family transcriptional regulator [Streptomyces sp. NPDC086787]|uniref:AfsR/SARP family transcriptional regulator n=1 Tax=Streptomyces sp. NPDC086787 TaxID=3365759 RepID=UPI00381E173D